MTRLFAFCLMALGLVSLSPVAAAEETSVQAFYADLAGDWTGINSLWLQPGTEAHKSDMTAQFKPTAKGAYFLMTYSWAWKDKPQAGVFLLGGQGEKATATWGDSWHQTPEPMQCHGTLSDDGRKIILHGSYAASSGPDWGWRTEFTLLGPDVLRMAAYNITPEGQEALAIRAELTRAGKR